MLYARKTSLAISCLLGLAGACSNTGTPQGGGTGTPQGGSAPTGTGGTSTPVGGTTGSAGTTTPKGGSGATGATTGGSTATGTGGMSTGTGGTGATSAAGSTATGGTSGGNCSGAGPAKTGMCKATANGVYAMKVDVDVWYMDEVNSASGGLQLFDPGRGKITIYFRNSIDGVCDDGSGGTALAHPCGTRIPALYTGTVAGVIQILFPDELWDKPTVPDYMTTGHTTGFDAGSILTIDKVAGLLGIDLSSVDAAWPTYDKTATFACSGGKMGADCFPDADGDGKPGITVKIQTTGMPPSPGYMAASGDPWAYVPAPTGIPEALAKAGADTVYTGLRTKVGGSGAIGADCKSGMGDADADDFESRVIDCVSTDGTPCTSGGAMFVDQNTPAFHVLKSGATPPADWMTGADAMIDKSASMGPKSSVVRLGDVGQTFTCADVRAAFPQQ